MTKIDQPTCGDCAQLNCYRHETRYPSFCLTTEVTDGQRAELAAKYQADDLDATIARAAAEVEGIYYGRLTRVEETLAFARRIGAKRIGIATCVGLIEETRTFTKFLRLGELEPFAVCCKIGSIDKSDIGVPEEWKIRPGGFEACCNPILQARTLNAEKTDLNVIVGLCVGHDSLFIRHSEAPVTTLIVKDRVLGHNPAAALYTSRTYCGRLFDEEKVREL